MNILVLGGTRYFGKRLVEGLLDHGHAVTVATRGLTPDSFGNRVTRKQVDRTDPRSLQSIAIAANWDVVVDQICYSPDEAASACEAFRGRVGRYIHTSTASVYQTGGDLPEKAFDPFHYPLRPGSRSDFDYGEAKRLAEAVYFQKASFPVAAMRIPIVLGSDDYTGRLEFHIDRVREGRPIVIPNPHARTSLISSAEAAQFLVWLAEGTFTGPINACSHGQISVLEILDLIEKRLHKKTTTFQTGAEADFTPLTDENSRNLDTSLAGKLGFRFEPLQIWLPALIDELCLRKTASSPS